MNREKFVILAAVFLVAFVAFGFGVFFVKHTAEITLDQTFILDCPYDKVKRVMLTTDVLEEMVSCEQGKIIKKKWKKLVASGDRIFRDGISIDGESDFWVLKSDPDMGDLFMVFHQTISVDKSGFSADTVLNAPVKYIQALETNMEITPEGNQTHVKTSIHLKYKRRVPRNMVEEVNRRVKESAEQSLRNNKEVVTMLVSKYGDKRFVIPLLRNF